MASSRSSGTSISDGMELVFLVTVMAMKLKGNAVLVRFRLKKKCGEYK
jgi:hypothetical protein